MGLLKTAAKVGVASAVHGRVQRRQQQRWAAQDQAHPMSPPPAPMAPPHAAAPPPPAAPPAMPALSSAERLAQLKTLGELRDGGVLTDSEFEAEKRKLLGS
jgi:hypothetical protein